MITIYITIDVSGSLVNGPDSLTKIKTLMYDHMKTKSPIIKSWESNPNAADTTTKANIICTLNNKDHTALTMFLSQMRYNELSEFSLGDEWITFSDSNVKEQDPRKRETRQEEPNTSSWWCIFRCCKGQEKTTESDGKKYNCM